jgi:hypothetical protein
VAGRLAEALAYGAAAALGVADPTMGTQKAAEARRLALDTSDTAAIVVASWAQAAAAHARGELYSSVWADLRETHHVPHLALRVFDGQLCIMQRFLYGTRPYPDVVSFADALAVEAHRVGAVRGPLETCPGCRITFAVPAAIAAARAGRLDLAAEYDRAIEYLANVVMHLPAWYAALEEVRAHVARARGDGKSVATARFSAAARAFREAGHPLDAARCDALAAGRP